MRLIVDGDGSPVKEEVILLGKKFNLPVWIVTSIDHYTTKEFDEHVKFIYVDKGADRADYQIIKELLAGDFLITQDYGLASLALAKQARIFHHSGKEYTSQNIDLLLNQRYMNAQMRQAKKKTKGPRPFTKEDRQFFYQKLTQILEQAIE